MAVFHCDICGAELDPTTIDDSKLNVCEICMPEETPKGVAESDPPELESCSDCGEEFPPDELDRGTCETCEEDNHCSQCGADLPYGGGGRCNDCEEGEANDELDMDDISEDSLDVWQDGE